MLYLAIHSSISLYNFVRDIDLVFREYYLSSFPLTTGKMPFVATSSSPPTAIVVFSIFTSLHGMQMRSSDENSVRLFVCPSNA